MPDKYLKHFFRKNKSWECDSYHGFLTVYNVPCWATVDFVRMSRTKEVFKPKIDQLRTPINVTTFLEFFRFFFVRIHKNKARRRKVCAAPTIQKKYGQKKIYEKLYDNLTSVGSKSTEFSNNKKRQIYYFAIKMSFTIFAFVRKRN